MINELKINELKDMFFYTFGIVPLQNYGAIGDGMTDNRLQIQQAIYDAIEVGAKYIFVPKGNYYYSGQLFQSDQVIFIGNNIYGNPDALAIKAKPGDYVKYDTGIDGVGENGDGIVTCRVLYNDDTYGLQIISDKNIEDVTLGGDTWEEARDSYNNAIEILNEKAEYYATSSPYAIDGRCVGSVPTIGTDGKFNAKNTEDVGPVQLQFTSTVEGANEMKNFDNNDKTDYEWMIKLENSGIKEMWTTGEYYWLASRDVYSDSTLCYFDVRRINRSGDVRQQFVCSIFKW